MGRGSTLNKKNLSLTSVTLQLLPASPFFKSQTQEFPQPELTV